MTAGWVASTTRGRALLGRLVGADGARRLAVSTSWPEARSQFATTLYGTDMAPDADRVTARTAAATATSWQLRVLAGWCPPGSTGLVRVFGAPFELTNIMQHVDHIDDHDTHREGSIPLGSLAVAWPHVASTTTPDQVRTVLSHSPWGDPGGADAQTMRCGLRVSWCRRLVRQVPESKDWSHGALAVLIARERFGFGREIAGVTGRQLDQELGRSWRSASAISDLVDRLPKPATWALVDVEKPEDLWLAELALVRRASAEAHLLVKRSRFDRTTVAAVMALLLVDLWHVSAAIAVAGRQPMPMEVFDVVA